jgi:hypothetical protein
MGGGSLLPSGREQFKLSANFRAAVQLAAAVSHRL